MLFLVPTHHHAPVAGLDGHCDALGLDGVLDRLGNLRGQALLDLQAARERFDEARYFTQADHFSVGDVGHVHLAKKRQKVVLAQAEHFDVFHYHHLVVADSKERLAQKRFGIVLVSLDEKLHGLLDARGGARKAFAIGIFAQADKHFAHQFFVGGAGEGEWYGRRFHRFLVVSRWSLVVGELYPQTTNDHRLTTVFSRVLKRVHHRLFNAYLL